MDKVIVENLEYCRICLRKIPRLAAISQEIEETFQLITQIDLINSSNYSNLICTLCERKLKNARKFREELIENEIQLRNEMKEFEKVNEDDFIEYSVEDEENYESLDDKLVENKINKSTEKSMDLETDSNQQQEELLKSTKNRKDLVKNSTSLKSNDNKNLPKHKDSTEISSKFNQSSSSSPQIINKPQTPSFPSQKSSKSTLISFKKSSKQNKNSRKFQNLPTTPNGKVICEHCNKSVIKNYYHHHIRRLHLNLKNFTCDNCDKQFYKKSSLASHMHIHLNNRPYQCIHQGCDKGFLSSTALATHVRFHHTSFNQYVCGDCGKGYKQKRVLEEHVRSKHTGERIFKCDHENCDSAYFSMSAMRKHTKSHESEGMTCEMCGKIYKNLSNLKAHVRLSHSKAEFNCEYENCDKKFGNKCFLKNHLKSHENKLEKIIEYLDFETLDEEILTE